MKPEQSLITIVSANLGRWLGPQLPEAVAEAARAYLRGHEPARRLRGAWVMLFGDDLHLHLTTFRGEVRRILVGREVAAALARGAALAALARGFGMGLEAAAAADSPLQLTGAAQEAALDLRRLDYPFTERGADPVIVAKALNGS